MSVTAPAPATARHAAPTGPSVPGGPGALGAPGEGAGGPTVGRLLVATGHLSPLTPTRQVAERFFADPRLDALALTVEGRPVGLITRSRLLLKLARGFGQELYARKPISRVADAAPLVLPESTGVATAVAAALDRPAAAVYDEVVVVDGTGRYLGLLSVRQLVLEQGLALARSAADREAALARTAALERLDELRARFLAHATHELRSPVNVVVGVAELVRRHAEKEAWPQVAARLPVLQRAATTLRATINNILDLSKLEAGRTEVSLGPVELSPLLEDVADTCRLLAADKPIAVEVVRAEVPAEVVTDGLKLRRILTNLASNAAKFTERGTITLGAACEPDGLRVWVADTGVGIREEDQERLFKPFGQLADPTSRLHEGTGLGLVITRSLAHLLGGRVEVASRHGDGTTFTVHLPTAEEAP